MCSLISRTNEKGLDETLQFGQRLFERDYETVHESNDYAFDG